MSKKRDAGKDQDVYAVRVTKADRGGLIGPDHRLVGDMSRAVGFTRAQAERAAAESAAAGNKAEVVPHASQALGRFLRRKT